MNYSDVESWWFDEVDKMLKRVNLKYQDIGCELRINDGSPLRVDGWVNNFNIEASFSGDRTMVIWQCKADNVFYPTWEDLWFDYSHEFLDSFEMILVKHIDEQIKNGWC